MARDRSATILAQKANEAIARFEYLRIQARELRIERRKLLRAIGRERKFVPKGPATWPDIGQIVSSAQDLRQATEALRKDVERWRNEVRRKRVECRKQFRAFWCRQEFINCEDFNWGQTLHRCLYKGLEAVLVNFDYDLHGESGSVIAREFQKDFTMMFDHKSKSVRFRRRSVFPR